MTNSATNHHIDCAWHLDQYNWECTCGAVKNPAECRPDFKALLAAMEDALSEHRLEEAMGTSPEAISIEEADRIISENPAPVEETMKAWVLWYRYDSAADVLRAYTDFQRAMEDYELLKDGTYREYLLTEVVLYDGGEE